MSQLELGLVLPAVAMPTSGAVISACELYRYILTRTWDTTLPPLVICMLNPSTADGQLDDPTIRKVIGFAKRLGYGGIVVVNLYAYRATDPKDLATAAARGVDVVGPDNDVWIKHACGIGKRELVLGYGAAKGGWYQSDLDRRVQRVVAIAGELAAQTFAIGVNPTSNTPRHPLMTPYTTPMTPWSPG